MAPNGSAIQIVTNLNDRIRIQMPSLSPILAKVGDRPVAIISVNGPMRTGKSYILGHFLRYFRSRGRDDWFDQTLDSEFHWENSADRQTTGILMWSEPFFVTRRGEEIGVLIMDTQGCFDDKTESGENSMLFALSCMMSSVLVYNIKHQLSEDVLQFLQLFLGFAKMPLEEGEDEPFSNLVLLIRDWQFPKTYRYGCHDKKHPKDKNYLKEKMQAHSGMPDEVKEVHTAVLSSFKRVTCCLLPHPGKELAVEDNVDRLDSEFVAGLMEFVPAICADKNVVPKTIGGQRVTGRQLEDIVRCWDRALARTEKAEIRTMAAVTAEKQNYDALTRALALYKETMEAKVKLSSCDLSAQKLADLHRDARRKALEKFRAQKKMKYASIEEKFREDLGKQIDFAYGSYQEIHAVRLKFGKLEAKSEEERARFKEDLKSGIQAVEKRMAEKARKEEEARVEREKKERKRRDKIERELREECEKVRRSQKKSLEEKEREMDRVRRDVDDQLEEARRMREKARRKREEPRDEPDERRSPRESVEIPGKPMGPCSTLEFPDVPTAEALIWAAKTAHKVFTQFW